MHQNDVTDTGYQSFSQPLADAITRDFHPQSVGLDYGSGPDSALGYLLRKSGFQLKSYDPFFAANTDVLQITYDYIVCCEVVEHFHYPAREFQQLNKLLKTGGKLYIMTDLYHDGIDFSKWYYKNDLTHAFFYQADTFKFIRQHFGFQGQEINGRITTLLK